MSVQDGAVRLSQLLPEIQALYPAAASLQFRYVDEPAEVLSSTQNGNGLEVDAAIRQVRISEREVMDDFRVSRKLRIAGRSHDVSVGAYLMSADESFTRYSAVAFIDVENHARLMDVVALDSSGRIIGTATEHGIIRDGAEFADGRGEQQTGALYAADEWQLNDALRIDVGARAEWMHTSGASEGATTVNLGQTGTLADKSYLTGNGVFTPYNRSFFASTWSAGVNWQLHPTQGIFARVTSATRLPSISDFITSPSVHTTGGPLMVSKFPALEINARLSELLLALLFCIASCKWSVAAEAARVDMTPERWLADGKVSFRKSELYPHGVMQVTGAGAVLKDTTFGNGTIEYDINEDGDEQETSGIWFRRQSAEVAENFYLRPFADCASTAECVQYAPVSRGNVQWDVYPEYEAAAPVKLKGWNHVKLVISGKRMNVFINGEAKPSMVVGCLGGESPTGAVQLRGNALYANLTLAPELVEGLNEEPLEDPTDKDPRFVRHWRLSPILSLPRGQSPELSAMSVESLSWRPIDAERKGFVNIGRGNGTPQGVPDLAWLKTNINSERAQTRHAAIGWVRQIWVYVNGRQVFAGNNVYYPESARTPPLGRLSLGNGSFDLPLRKGPNEEDVAISDDLGHIRHWGWGYQLRLDDIQGISFPSDNRAYTSAPLSDVNH